MGGLCGDGWLSRMLWMWRRRRWRRRRWRRRWR